MMQVGDRVTVGQDFAWHGTIAKVEGRRVLVRFDDGREVWRYEHQFANRSEDE
jgi:hypothetical protein